ncbi:signaling lymphocytic activation molecule isoform X1 [Panthera leo]|uniref:signaling lymphocytic activation molecule isoform X1 n=1 Tax=Panthera leo TaxID=9689 RepID=UPI001C697063|nr:signaling lymphocytic activation molecule isoform X1 [Panthera leo]
MDLKGLLSLNFLLFLSLAFELSCGTGESLMNCQEVTKQLGGNLLLPLASEGISKSMNKSIHILVTKSESPQKNVKRKIMSLSLPERASLRFLENGYKFHPENLKLEILQSKKENEGWYFTTLEENFSVRHFCLQLKLFEQVSTPEIKVLNWTQENGNCSLTLACEVERGDHVAYSWREETGADPPVSANSSHLHLSLGPQHVHNVYVCTVSNPISNHSQTFTPGSVCMPDLPGECPGGGRCGTLTTRAPPPAGTNGSCLHPGNDTLHFSLRLIKASSGAFSGCLPLVIAGRAFCSVPSRGKRWSQTQSAGLPVVILPFPSCLGSNPQGWQVSTPQCTVRSWWDRSAPSIRLVDPLRAANWARL